MFSNNGGLTADAQIIIFQSPAVRICLQER